MSERETGGSQNHAEAHSSADLIVDARIFVPQTVRETSRCPSRAAVSGPAGPWCW